MFIFLHFVVTINKNFAFNITMICLSPSEVVLLGTNIALELAKNKTAGEIAVLRSIATQVAASLFTFAAQETAITEYCKDKTE